MNEYSLKRLIDVAAGRCPADTVIGNCRVVDIHNACIIDGDIAIVDGLIAGVGRYEGKTVVDAEDRFAAPAFIDSHIHIESSHLSPGEFGRLAVPRGTATVIADPHEIVNVCGLAGLDYMLAAGGDTALDIRWMLPSCVPATPFETSGAVLDAGDMAWPLADSRIGGLGEFMDYPGVIAGDDRVIAKLLAAKRAGKVIDGHSPAVMGNDLNAYAAAGILTDHECATLAEMRARIARGMYVLLRQGSACHDLQTLLPGVTAANSRRCLLCSDDRQPRTLLEDGHIDDHLRRCVQAGIDAFTALRMASLNAAECYRLHDRGALTPGLRADIVLLDSLESFRARRVFIAGEIVACDGRYLPEATHRSSAAVAASFRVAGFSADKLRLHLQSDRVNVIGINPGSVVTSKLSAAIRRDSDGDFLFNPAQDIAKIAVVERHHRTGNVAVALLAGYGIKHGAIALSIAHDSHNIIAVGTDNRDMAAAVEELLAQNGGVTLVRDGRALERLPLPIGGIMSDQSGERVAETLSRLHRLAVEELGVSSNIDPVMTLCFMSLAVIPEVKITDKGLFDVTRFCFMPLER